MHGTKRLSSGSYLALSRSGNYRPFLAYNKQLVPSGQKVNLASGRARRTTHNPLTLPDQRGQISGGRLNCQKAVSLKP